MTPNIPLALVLVAVAAVALRAAVRRPEPPQAPGSGAAPVTVVASPGQSQPRPAATTSTHDGIGADMARLSAPPGRPASTVDQAQHIFHELHAEARHALCAICDSQYGPA